MNRLCLFPCMPNKRPYSRHGFKSASDDPATLDYWAWKYPGCLWGAPIPDGLFVLDVDPRHAGDQTLAELTDIEGALPLTLTCRTRSGGLHYWFSTPAPVRQDSRGNLLGPGLDTRCAGRGYCIVPPSKGWIWTAIVPVAESPEWLVRRLRRPEPKPRSAPRLIGNGRRLSYAEAALKGEVEAVRSCPIGLGVRNATLHRSACRLGQLVGAELLDVHKVTDALLAASSLPEKEALATITSGVSWGANHPRQVRA